MTPKADSLRVPLALIGPIWGLVAGICVLAWTWQESDKMNKMVLTGLQKDMATTTRTLSRMEKKVDVAYPRGEAEKEFQRVNGVLEDHEVRLRRLEQ